MLIDMENTDKILTNESPYRMKVVCAWCGDHIGWSRSIKPGQTSHGICQDCLDVQRANLAALPDDF